jgi:hypothetical protein
MKIEIDQEISDKIVTGTILEDIALLRRDIMRLGLITIREDYQESDLLNNMRYLDALELAAEYYIGFGWENRVPKAGLDG